MSWQSGSSDPFRDPGKENFPPMDNMFSSSGGESPRQEVHLQHQDIEFISQLKPASIMPADSAQHEDCAESILEGSSSDDEGAVATHAASGQAWSEHIREHLLSPERPVAAGGHVTLRGTGELAPLPNAAADPSSLHTPQRSTAKGVPDSANSVMSNRGLHLLGSPLLSPFAAMPQLYSTPQRQASAAWRRAASPDESPIHTAHDASPAGMMQTAAGCPLTPASPAGRVQDTPPSHPGHSALPRARRARVLSPPLHPALHTVYASPVLSDGASFASLHSIGDSPACSPPEAPPHTAAMAAAGASAPPATELSRSSGSVSMALDFSESTASTVPAGTAAACALGIPPSASPVMDPATGRFLGYFVASPQLHTTYSGVQLDGSAASAAGSDAVGQLSSLLPLGELPSGSVHAHASANSSAHTSTNESLPNASSDTMWANQQQAAVPAAVTAAPPADSTAAPTTNRRRQAPGAWMSHYLESLGGRQRPQASARTHSPLSASRRETHAGGEGASAPPSSSPLQRRQLRSKWWLPPGNSHSQQQQRKCSPAISPGEHWGESLRDSVRTAPLQQAACRSRRLRWQATEQDLGVGLQCASPRLHPSHNLGSAVREGRGYGLTGADAAEYAAMVARPVRAATAASTGRGGMSDSHASSAGRNLEASFDRAVDLSVSPILRESKSSFRHVSASQAASFSEFSGSFVE